MLCITLRLCIFSLQAVSNILNLVCFVWTGKNPELESTRTEVHSVASVLKSYFRELPEPLIPYDYFEVFLTAARCKY